jgi:hypothetical protein
MLKSIKNINREDSKGLFPLLSSHTTVRAVRHMAVCQNNGSCFSAEPSPLVVLAFNSAPLVFYSWLPAYSQTSSSLTWFGRYYIKPDV